MSVLCFVMFSFLYLVIFISLVLCHKISVQLFFVFVNFSNIRQVYLNLRVHLIVFCLHRLCANSVIVCTSVFLYFSILVMFFQGILICECTCLFLSSV